MIWCWDGIGWLYDIMNIHYVEIASADYVMLRIFIIQIDEKMHVLFSWLEAIGTSVQ